MASFTAQSRGSITVHFMDFTYNTGMKDETCKLWRFYSRHDNNECEPKLKRKGWIYI